MGSGIDRYHEEGGYEVYNNSKAPLSVYEEMDMEEDKEATFPKQERYQDLDGKLDYIDACAAEFTPEEFRGAMKFTIGKYSKRLGKKDSIVKEVTKIADYANRWLQYEIELESKGK